MSTGQIATSQNAVLWGTIAMVVTLAAGWWQHRAARRNRIPSKWRRVGEISELIIYPLKSGKGFEIKEAECTEIGMKTTEKDSEELRHMRDRSLVLYNQQSGDFVTMRQFPSMALVKTTYLSEDVVVLEAPNVQKLQLKLPNESSSLENNKVTMWFGEKVETVDCGDEAADWFNSFLKREDKLIRLGCHVPGKVPRRKTAEAFSEFKKYYKRIQNDYSGAFSDMASFMVLSEASLIDLKSKLPPHLQSIPAKQFRPNIVVRGTDPYAEDDWDWIKIGDSVVLRGFKPCTRCTVTTMDPETGVREPNMEPLRTLKGYRQVKDPAAKNLEGDAPVLGLYTGLHATGFIKIGDPVYIG